MTNKVDKFLELLEIEEAHPSSRKFYESIMDCAILHSEKQKDYGTDEDPFRNVRAAEEFGVPSWLAAFVRLNDKVQRIKAFSKKGTLSNESVEDSLEDIAVYALIGLVLYREESEKNAPKDDLSNRTIDDGSNSSRDWIGYSGLQPTGEKDWH